MKPKIKQILLLLIPLISEACFAGEYSNCILENMKGIATPPAAFAIRKACREKVLPYIPAKCSYSYLTEANKDNPFNAFDQGNSFINQAQEACIEECLNASYWSKHFGDCKK